jgi:hypothetical protein
VFIADGTTVKYRQAQTWTMARRPPNIIGAASAPSNGWTDYRTNFVNDARDKFGKIAILDEPIGEDRLKTILTNAAQNATTKFGPSFFIEEGIDIFPDGSQTAAEAAASVKPRSNGDPVTATPKTALELDDTTVVTTIGGTDAFPTDSTNSKFEIRVSILAQVIDQPVLIADGPDYRRVSSRKARAPSDGPKPVGGGAGSGSGSGSGTGATNGAVESMSEELLALGATQQDVAELAAAAPEADAPEEVATSPPDEVLDVGELDRPRPGQEIA